MELLIKSMNDLKVEMSGFRAEMKEFKKTVDKRIDSEGFNDEILDKQLEINKKRNKLNIPDPKIIGIIGCVMSCVSMGFLIIEKLVR